MLTNRYQEKSASGPKQLFKKQKQKNTPFYRERSVDDYLIRLATMKERGGLVIGGRRVC
jgi:hypothetical protein